jgi:hypothetical protein
MVPHFWNFYCVVDVLLYEFVLNVCAELATYALAHSVCAFSYGLPFCMDNRGKMR